MKVKYNIRIKGFKYIVDGFVLLLVEFFIFSNVIFKCKIMWGEKSLLLCICVGV